MVMAASLLCCYGAAQSLHDLGVIPLHRAEMPGDLASLAVDEEARRQANRIYRERGLRRRIDVERQRLDAGLRVEPAGDRQALLIDRQRDHLEALAAELRLQAIERRHLLAAGLAPRRPDIEQHQLAAKVGERARPAIRVVEAQLGNRLRLRGVREGQLALRLPGAQIDAERRRSERYNDESDSGALVHARPISRAQL